ncbi:hypothetical protein [Dinghuibacter silviterrae]|uniref:Uncharacterized protein n=1 Tax=Dinghuibacter silviterrae TaxID=1539049 RepID=A0A4V3GKU1_9BACT|nr:hypothetical protein [Dinghuibacter silviterrae]TDW96962.1 hypothetical protein EDB95_4798 [Dinghuibacter silviterrae]
MTNDTPPPGFHDLLDGKNPFFERLPAYYRHFTVRDVRVEDEFNTGKRVLARPSPDDEQVFCPPFYKRISKCF